jgi:hypothetical protein
MGAPCEGVPFRMHEPLQCSPYHSRSRADVAKRPVKISGAPFDLSLFKPADQGYVLVDKRKGPLGCCGK